MFTWKIFIFTFEAVCKISKPFSILNLRKNVDYHWLQWKFSSSLGWEYSLLCWWMFLKTNVLRHYFRQPTCAKSLNYRFQRTTLIQKKSPNVSELRNNTFVSMWQLWQSSSDKQCSLCERSPAGGMLLRESINYYYYYYYCALLRRHSTQQWFWLSSQYKNCFEAVLNHFQKTRLTPDVLSCGSISPFSLSETVANI